MELVVLTPDGEAFPFLRIVDEGVPADGLVSEITGPAFSPDGRHLYFGSQRGGPANRGVSYVVSGPFRAVDAAAGATTTTAAATSATTLAGGGGGGSDGDDGESDLALPLVGGAMVLGLAATGAIVWRVRTRDRTAGDDSGDAPESR